MVNEMEMDELLKVSRAALGLGRTFDKEALTGLKTTSYTWFTFLHAASTQFDTLDSVLFLFEKGRQKDCFVLLRSVFESSFFLMLMMHGKRFRERRRYQVVPNEGQNPRDARDATLEKWKESRRLDDPRYSKVVDIDRGKKEDIIRVTLEDEGLYDVEDKERKGDVVSRYYFAFEQYDPEAKFVSHLPHVSAEESYSELSRHQLITQRELYNQYFYIKTLERNLKLNGFLNEEQLDRFIVHYSFLSMYVHPIKPGTPRVNRQSYMHPYTPAVIERCSNELVLLYVCKFQSMLLQTLIGFFRSVNPQLDTGKYRDQIKELDAVTKDLWFIYDEPTEFDRKRSEKDKVLYYKNPLKRLADIRLSEGKVYP